MHTARGYAAMSSGAALESFTFRRRDLRPASPAGA